MNSNSGNCTKDLVGLTPSWKKDLYTNFWKTRLKKEWGSKQGVPSILMRSATIVWAPENSALETRPMTSPQGLFGGLKRACLINFRYFPRPVTQFEENSRRDSKTVSCCSCFAAVRPKSGALIAACVLQAPFSLRNRSTTDSWPAFSGMAPQIRRGAEAGSPSIKWFSLATCKLMIRLSANSPSSKSEAAFLPKLPYGRGIGQTGAVGSASERPSALEHCAR